MEVKAQSAADIDCWHCGLKGHYKSDNSKLQLKELDVGIQNLNIDIYDKAHSLFSVDKSWTKVQKEKKEKSGVCGIFLKHHKYINTCTRYASALYPELLENMRTQARSLVGHSKAGSCGMDTAGEMGALK